MDPYRTAALAVVLPAMACHSAPRTDEALWIVNPAPSVRIDWDADIDGYDLHDVRAAIRLDDGRIAVVDGGSAEIRWFDRDGVFVGRHGGDSIFHRIKEAVRAAGDTITVRTLDPAIVRISVGTGAIASRVALAPAMNGMGWLSPDGSLLIPSDGPSDPGSDSAGASTVTMARFDPATETFDTLAVIPGGERPHGRRLAFPCVLTVGQAPDRFFAAGICDDSIVVSRYDGARVGVQHSGLERKPVPQAVVERASARPYPPEVPAEYPRIARLLADRTGHLWVMAYPQVDADWGILAA